MKRFEATAAFITGFYLAATMGANANENAIRMSSVSNNTSDYTLEIAINQMGFDRPDQPASARIAPKKSAIITSKSPSSVSQCFYNIRVNYYGATGERFSEKERYLENIDFCKTEIPVDSQGDFTISESMFIADGPDRIIISDGLGAAGAAKPATQSIQASGDAPGPASQQAGRPYARPAPVVVPPPGARRLPGGGFFADTLVAGAQMSASRTSPASAPASRPSVVARPAAAAPAASAPASSPQPGPPLGSGVSVGSGIPTIGATPPTMAAGGATIALANPQPGLPPQPYVLPQPNPSQVAPSGGAKDARIVEFLFATNRSRPDPSRPTEFSFGRMPSLTLGAVRVRVPEDHKIGRIELPGNYKVLSFTIWKDEFQKEKHFKVDQIVTINRERWLKQISSNPDGEVLIFVHGFNTTFEDSVYRAAQIAWDLQYPGTMILFSWPSRGNSVAHYDYDQNSALNARDRFLDLVTLVQTETKTKRVHVIAHSMGNRVVVDALANYGKTTNPARSMSLSWPRRISIRTSSWDRYQILKK